MVPANNRCRTGSARLTLYLTMFQAIVSGAPNALASPETSLTADASPSASSSVQSSDTSETAIESLEAELQPDQAELPATTTPLLLAEAALTTFQAISSDAPSPTFSATPTAAPDRSIWRRGDGDSEDALAYFVDALNEFRAGPFTGINGVLHFQSGAFNLQLRMIHTWDRWVPTEARLDDIFEVFVNALRTVDGASSASREDFAKMTYWFLVKNHSGSARANRFFLYMFSEEMDRPGGAERFCVVYDEPRRANVSEPLRLAARALVPQRLAAEYLFMGARIAQCVYDWTIASGPDGYRDAFAIAATGLARGDTDWLRIVADYLRQLTDEEPAGMLDDLGVMTGVAVIAATRGERSGEAAAIIASSRTASTAHWQAIMAGLINNSTTDVSASHFRALVRVSAAHPELSTQLRDAAITALGIPDMPTNYYLWLGLFVGTFDSPSSLPEAQPIF